MTFLLYVILITGESGTIPVPDHLCHMVPREVSLGSSVGLVTEDGRDIEIARAACLGPVDADPCSLEPIA